MPDCCRLLTRSAQVLARSGQNLARFWPDLTRIRPDPGQILAGSGQHLARLQRPKDCDIYEKRSIVKLTRVVKRWNAIYLCNFPILPRLLQRFPPFLARSWPDPGRICPLRTPDRFLGASSQNLRRIITDPFRIPCGFLEDPSQIPYGFLGDSLQNPYTFLKGPRQIPDGCRTASWQDPWRFLRDPGRFPYSMRTASLRVSFPSAYRLLAVPLQIPQRFRAAPMQKPRRFSVARCKLHVRWM